MIAEVGDSQKVHILRLPDPLEIFINHILGSCAPDQRLSKQQSSQELLLTFPDVLVVRERQFRVRARVLDRTKARR